MWHCLSVWLFTCQIHLNEDTNRGESSSVPQLDCPVWFVYKRMNSCKYKMCVAKGCMKHFALMQKVHFPAVHAKSTPLHLICFFMKVCCMTQVPPSTFTSQSDWATLILPSLTHFKVNMFCCTMQRVSIPLLSSDAGGHEMGERASLSGSNSFPTSVPFCRFTLFLNHVDILLKYHVCHSFACWYEYYYCICIVIRLLN